MLVRILLICAGLLFGCSQLKSPGSSEPDLSSETHGDPLVGQRDAHQVAMLEEFLPVWSREDHRIRLNSTVYENLVSLGMEPQSVLRMVKATKGVYNLARIPGGTRFRVEKDAKGKIQRLTFTISAMQRLVVSDRHLGWFAKSVVLPTERKLRQFNGKVQGNLWNSAVDAGTPPSLIIALADVFSWEVDFSREIRPGDFWRFTVEQVLVEGRPIGWGKIIKAIYNNQGREYSAFYYESPKTGVAGYYDKTGRSLRKMFLKSPLKFGRVTSGFSRRRFHPIKKVYRCLLYTSPSPRDRQKSRMPSSA